MRLGVARMNVQFVRHAQPRRYKLRLGGLSREQIASVHSGVSGKCQAVHYLVQL